MKSLNITIVGSGYVGLSLAVLLAQKNNVKVLDIDEKKIEKINNKISPIQDNEIEDFLRNKDLGILATSDLKEAYIEAEFIIIATPTNYNEETNSFDVSSIDAVLADINQLNNTATVIIKSTVPLGFTDSLKSQYKNKIYFSPEFLREGSALKDNLEPSRIIISSSSDSAKKFIELLKSCSIKQDIPIFHMSAREAESVKLFSNTYLAMRISFFNELDSYSMANNLNTENIIMGVSADPRIGNQYNNPSFGYGGYCLPKDTKQLLSNFKNVPQNIIESVVLSNDTRIKYIASKIIHLKPKTVGVYRLVMKHNSDNFRESAITKVLDLLIEKGIKVVIYEPMLKKNIGNIDLIEDLEDFKSCSDLIIANRMSGDIKDVYHKVFTRDIFNRD
tara:strand:+ start:2192 stop:3361 length:1170 start_codon:yes stop_codon:yes gene_type:complete